MTAPTPDLLDIPAELRCQMYELALASDSLIDYDATFKLPGVLTACHLIYAEAMPIFYTQNEFKVEIEDHHPRFIADFDRMAWNIETQFRVRPIAHLRMKGIPNWANLMEYCKHVCTFYGRKRFPKQHSHGTPNRRQAVATTALHMAWNHEYSSWDKCKAVLEVFRYAAGHIDPPWRQ